MPPVPGNAESYLEVNKGTAVETQWIRYDPREPSPKHKTGGSSLRVEAYGCIEGKDKTLPVSRITVN